MTRGTRMCASAHGVGWDEKKAWPLYSVSGHNTRARTCTEVCGRAGLGRRHVEARDKERGVSRGVKPVAR